MTTKVNVVLDDDVKEALDELVEILLALRSFRDTG